MKFQDCQHMKNKEIKTVVPKLRFPEFGEAGEWKEKTIHAIGEVVTGNTPSKNEKKFWGGNFVWITAQDFRDKYIYDSVLKLTEKGRKKSKVIPQNSILVTCIASIGLNGINKIECATNQQINSVICYPDYDYEFIYYAISNNSGRLKSLAGQTAVPIISKSVFENFVIIIPEQKKEQQKIADCLSSIDDLIISTVKKIEALKAHKKGLMQQLFPAEGEKVPAIRFSEFQDAGEWKPVQLSQCLLKSPEYGINAPAVPYSDKLPVYLRITDISDDGSFISEQKVSVARKVTENNYLGEGDIVLARTGASVGKSYKYRKKDGRLVFAGFLIRIQPDAQLLNSEFIYQFLHTAQYWKWVNLTSARSGQPGINGSEYSSMPLLIPRDLEEQQKIAGCLSSLDELITALTQKLEALKTHKKGLMQQLFPDMTE